MKYQEKLKDPRWQKMRLEIMNRDEFTCQMCCTQEVTLHVHHRVYISGKAPWEYPEHLLVTLCENCHRDETFSKAETKDILYDSIAGAGLLNDSIVQLAELIHDRGPKNVFFPFFWKHILIAFTDPRVAELIEQIKQEHKAQITPSDDLPF